MSVFYSFVVCVKMLFVGIVGVCVIVVVDGYEVIVDFCILFEEMCCG